MAEKKTIERIYNVNLTKAYQKPRSQRSKYAVRELRDYLSHHMKVPRESVKIDPSINEKLFKMSIEHPPRRIRVTVKKEAEVVKVMLVEDDQARKTEKKFEKSEVKEKKKKPTKMKSKGEKDNTAA